MSSQTVTLASVQPAAVPGAGAEVPKPAPKLGKSGKKICCACPETKKFRDACVVQNGEDKCRKEIEAHNACLRLDGFDVA